MKKNKLFLLVAIFAAAFIFLAACNGGDPTETETDPGIVRPTPEPLTEPDTDTEPPVASELSGTITFSWWGNEGRHLATQEIAQLFMDENPGVVINFDYGAWGDWQDHMTISIFGNVEADLMQLNFNWLQLFSPFGDTFANLEDPVIAQHLDLSNWSAADLDVTRRNGVLQGVPAGMTARVPFMRADIYEAAGLNVQDINTWDDLIAAGNAIQEYHGDDTFALSPLGRASLAYMVFSYLEQFTGRQLIDANNQFNYDLEELTRAFELVERLRDNGVLAPPTEDAINAQNPRWIAGNYGGVSEWDSSINGWISNLAAEDGEGVIEVRPHFTYENAILSGFMARPSMAFGISRHSQYPEVAAAFLNFLLTDPRAIAIQGTDRGVPSNQAGLAEFQALVAAGEIGGAAVEANNIVQNATTTTMSPVFEFPVVRDLWEHALERIQIGENTAAEAAQFVYDNVQAEIDEFLDLD